jgi:multidrug efflux pump subunit AcrA (membrane-fusion protein)
VNCKLSSKCKPFVLSVVITALLTTAAGCGAGKDTAGQEVKKVKVTTAQVSSIHIDVEYSGKIKPLEEVVVSPKIAGKVSEIKADVGDAVEKGSVLFTLDKEDADALYRQSQANLDSANANLERTGGSALSQQVLQAESALQQAQVQYDNAKSLYEKTKALYDGNAVSKQQLDDVESGFKNAEIQLKTAQDNLTLLKEKAGPQSVKVAAAQVEQAKASMEQASIQLKNTEVTSPISGVVSVRNVDAGELISSAVPAYTVINTKTVLIEVNVPDKIVGKVVKGQAVKVRISALEGREYEGTVDVVSPSADVKTQSYTVRVKVDNTAGEIKSGMFARVLLPAESKEKVLTVPNEAIVVENGVQYVYTVSEGKVKKKAVGTGVSDGKITEITGNLNEGDYVITEGQNFLSDGEPVNVEVSGPEAKP